MKKSNKNTIKNQLKFQLVASKFTLQNIKDSYKIKKPREQSLNTVKTDINEKQKTVGKVQRRGSELTRHSESDQTNANISVNSSKIQQKQYNFVNQLYSQWPSWKIPFDQPNYSKIVRNSQQAYQMIWNYYNTHPEQLKYAKIKQNQLSNSPHSPYYYYSTRDIIYLIQDLQQKHKYKLKNANKNKSKIINL